MLHFYLKYSLKTHWKKLCRLILKMYVFFVANTSSAVTSIQSQRKEVAWLWLWEETGRNLTLIWKGIFSEECCPVLYQVNWKESKSHLGLCQCALQRQHAAENTVVWSKDPYPKQTAAMPAPHCASPQHSTGAKACKVHQQCLWEQNSLDQGISCTLQHRTGRQQTMKKTSPE